MSGLGRQLDMDLKFRRKIQAKYRTWGAFSIRMVIKRSPRDLQDVPKEKKRSWGYFDCKVRMRKRLQQTGLKGNSNETRRR